MDFNENKIPIEDSLFIKYAEKREQHSHKQITDEDYRNFCTFVLHCLMCENINTFEEMKKIKWDKRLDSLIAEETEQEKTTERRIRKVKFTTVFSFDDKEDNCSDVTNEEIIEEAKMQLADELEFRELSLSDFDIDFTTEYHK